MKPVDSFFGALRDSFRPGEDVGDWAPVILGTCVLLALVVWLVQLARRRQAAHRAFARLVAERRLSPADVSLLVRIAGVAAETPTLMATQIEVFERATAIEIENHALTLNVRDNDVFGRIQHLRQALGFHRLPEHFPLLTTRELRMGLAVKIGDLNATITDVTESFFSVRLTQPLTLIVGAEVPLTLIHAHEARYGLKCRLLAMTADDDKHTLVLAHDEHPSRLQLREFVRVAAPGPVRLKLLPGQPRDAQLDKSAPPPAIDALLLDISVGGAALEIGANLAAGTHILASFTLGETPFVDLRAVVLECRRKPSGAHRLRLEFKKLVAADEQRLSAAVAHQSAKPVVSEEKLAEGVE